MTPEQILSLKEINLKPNKYLRDPNAEYIYQRRGSLMMLVRPRMILGDDVGVGKTIEAITTYTYVKAAREDTKALVFTERNALEQWKDEFHKWTVGITPKVITAETHPDVAKRISAIRTGSQDVIITTYSMLYDYSQYLLEAMQPRWMLIADEPNYFKNMETMLYRNIKGIAVGDMDGKPYRPRKVEVPGEKYARWDLDRLPGERPVRAYGLTATVIENKLEEAYAISTIIAPGTFPSHSEFVKDHCITKKFKGMRVVVGYKNLDLFRKRLGAAYFGRLADDPEVKQNLPEVVTKDMKVVMTIEQSKKVLEVMDRIVQMPDGEVKQVGILPSLIMAQQMVNDPALLGFDIKSAKLEALVEALTNSLSGQKVVIYSKLRTGIDRIEARLKKEGIDTLRITGAETAEQRETNKLKFQDPKNTTHNVMLITKAGAKAVNLQKGGLVFFYDMPWSYGLYRQIIGRVRRTGSEFKFVTVCRMICLLHPDVAAASNGEDTIDGYALSIVMKKFKLWQAVTGDIKEIESSVSEMKEIWDSIRTGKNRAPA